MKSRHQRVAIPIAALRFCPVLVSGALLVATLCGCGSSEPQAGATSSGSAQPSSVGLPAASVSITLDGEAIAKVTTTELATRKRLIDLLPEAAKKSQFRTLEAQSGKRTLKLRELESTYADQDICLFIDAAGLPAVGMFRRVTDDMPPWMKAKLEEPTVSLDGIETLELRTKERNDVSAGGSFVLQVQGGDKRTVTDADLAGLVAQGKGTGEGKGDGQGGTKKQRKQGTPLVSVVELSLPLAEVGTLIARAGDKTLELSGDELRASGFAGAVRRNRRGQLVLRLSEDKELRDVESFEIVKKGATAQPKGSASSAP